MTQTQKNADNKVKILLSFRDQNTKAQAKGILQRGYPTQLALTEMDLLQDAMDLLEKGQSTFDVVLFEHTSPSVSLVKAFIELGKYTSFVMCSADEVAYDALKSIERPPEFVLISDIEKSVQKVFTKLSTLAKVPPMVVLDEELYVSASMDNLLATSPLKYDVFVRMGKEGRFVRLFKKEITVERADLEKYSKGAPNFFFVKKSDGEQILREQAAKIDAITAQDVVPIATAKTHFADAINSVRDVVGYTGFTNEAQMVAKSSVAMSLKALGSKPKLSSILGELKKKEGEYLVSHSFMVGQVACALAYKLGWNSPATFFKLSLAGFMHDITLNAEPLAEVDSYEKAKGQGKFSEAELQLIRFHTMKAAEYSKAFTEIPSDVDIIVSQHHERPDGTGFPRGLSGKLISPLAALFIMAHDLVHAVYANPDENTEQYFEKHADLYQAGQFKKIVVGLKAAPAVSA